MQLNSLIVPTDPSPNKCSILLILVAIVLLRSKFPGSNLITEWITAAQVCL